MEAASSGSLIEHPGSARDLVSTGHGTRARHNAARPLGQGQDVALDLRFLLWGGEDLNLRPTDYEDCATSLACRIWDDMPSERGFIYPTPTGVSHRFAVHRGANAGHIRINATPTERERTADLRFPLWGGEDLNLRPTDYESAALTD